MSGAGSGAGYHYRPGDVVNGHMLGTDGRWVAIAQQGTSHYPWPGSPAWGGQPFGPRGSATAPYGQPYHYPPQCYQQQTGIPVRRYRPGDVVNGYSLNERYEWVPVTTTGTPDARNQRASSAVAVGAGLAGFIPILGLIGAVVAIVHGSNIVSSRSEQQVVDFVFGAVAVALGATAVIFQLWLY